MKIKVGFLAHGPASANSLKPLIEHLRNNHTIETHLYPYHKYVSELWMCDYTLGIKHYPKQMRELDIIVYGTGSGNPIETGLAEFGKKHGIITISIMDLYWSSLDGLSKRYPCSPDYIIAVNDFNQKQLLNLDIDSEILPLGNPHFDRLVNYLGIYQINEPMVVAFFSQCSETNDYSDTMEDSKLALQSLTGFALQNPKLIKEIHIAVHPREDPRWLINFADDRPELLTISSESSTDLMLRADLTTGCHCTLQYEAEMVGKPMVAFNRDERQYHKELLNLKEKTFAPKLTSFNSTHKNLCFITNLVDSLILNKIKSETL